MNPLFKSFEHRTFSRQDRLDLQVADLNGDNNLDIVNSNGGSDNASVQLGDGAGGFAPAVSFAVGDAPGGALLALGNGDQNLDLVSANVNDNNVAVLLGDGAGGFGTPWTLAVGDSLGCGQRRFQ